MKNKSILGPVLLLSLLSACKIQLDVPQGGHVVSVAGGFDCAAGQSCQIEVSSTKFSESLVAVPAAGMKFTGWERKERGLFGGSSNPEARISTASFEGNDALMSLLDSDEIFYLTPKFEVAAPGGVRTGGSPGTSINLKLPGKSEIATNSFYNYFKFFAKKGETLIVHADLTSPLSDQEKSRCGSNPGEGTTPSSYDTQMHIYDKDLNRITGICGENLRVQFEAGGKYYIQFDYPGNGQGIAYAASSIEGSFIHSPSGLPGTVGNPRSIIIGANNPLDRANYQNYYRYTAQEGERIILNVSLNQPMDAQQKTRCASAGDFPSTSYDTRVYVYDSNLIHVGGVCGEQLRFDFPSAGTYLFHFRYGTHSAGYFNAAVL